ncbi:hypothetical protein IW140_002325 [Coemansia sp. RSA 1813]|nr:hypothetical protein LPJ74_001972 [Coemansia sp. RSA 1843]KAJ2090763.1 hypothetical protein IW138_002381 [Coemansia sp. RSA 986]KAJ2216012.1 hypothetical protein EV179_001663 [Coemansia sp. RSA 487]KAJ2570425.1 hypothetical protein IW140_002325 [Coemansia sp. RSA 1813]
MQLKFSALLVCTSAFFLASATEPTSATESTSELTTSNLIVFGDSLADNGNTGKLINSTVYWDGRFSNSYVWNEYTAKLLGMTLANNAYGDATSNNDVTPAVLGGVTIPSFHDQVKNWLSANPAPSPFNLDNDIIQIEIGSNDLLNNAEGLMNGTVDITTLASRVAKSISADIQSLIDAGYKNVNLWNIPAIENTPLAASMNASALIAPAIEAMNSAIAKLVQSVFDGSKEKVQSANIFDIHSLMTTCMQSQVLTAFGITDSKDACYTTSSSGKPNICSDPDEHYFYDDVHPASRMHYIWGVSAAILARNPSTKMDTNEVLSIIKSFDIGSSNNKDNIIANGISSSESEAIPSASSGTGAASGDDTKSSESDHTSSTSSATGLSCSILMSLALTVLYFI